MSSGSSFPPPVRTVEIPKDSGGTRTLGIPTVADRIAQMVAKMYLEPLVEPHFHQDSYGYRPGKSAIQVAQMEMLKNLRAGMSRSKFCQERSWCTQRSGQALRGHIKQPGRSQWMATSTWRGWKSEGARNPKSSITIF
jgi:hypothetical protein